MATPDGRLWTATCCGRTWVLRADAEAHERWHALRPVTVECDDCGRPWSSSEAAARCCDGPRHEWSSR